MIAERSETLRQLQRRRRRVDPAGDDDAQQQFGQGESLAGDDRRRSFLEGDDGSATQRQQLQDRQQRQATLLEPENFAEAAGHRITTKVAMTAIIR